MGGKTEDVGNAVAVRESTDKMRVTLDEAMTLAMDGLEVVELVYWDDAAKVDRVLRFTRLLPVASSEARLIKLGEVLKGRVMDAMYPGRGAAQGALGMAA